jgi:hypothetical protein
MQGKSFAGVVEISYDCAGDYPVLNKSEIMERLIEKETVCSKCNVLHDIRDNEGRLTAFSLYRDSRSC